MPCLREVAGALVILLGAVAAAGAATAVEKPNIVFIMADDLGHGHLGCYGQIEIATPNIDRLAAEGMLLSYAYAGSAVCAPCRSVLMTGLHTGHTPVRNNGAGQRIEPEDVTVAEMLKDGGYATGGFGKWGLGDYYTSGRAYDQGFDVWVGQYNQAHAHFYYPWFVWKNDERVILPGNENGGRGQYVHDVVHEEELYFIREHRQGPFFAYLPYILPHVELVVPEEDEAPYRGRWPVVAIPDPRPGYLGSGDGYVSYAGMISRLDRHVGEVVALLGELGIAEKTLLIFTSDNGAQGGAWTVLQEFFGGSGGLRGLKGALYEGGIRVPFIARWPGRIKAGSRSDLPTCFYDMMPTLAEVAGLAKPEHSDGVSILPTLLGEGKQERHASLYWELGSQTAVRAGKWKAVRPHPRKDWELYDLEADQGEERDLAGVEPAVLEKLKGYAAEAHTEPRAMPAIPPSNYRDFVR